MSRIRVLSDQVANKIAAGEVVERPAAVVKELVENSLDAGATRIVLHLEAGGRNLIRVEDDGRGMDGDDAVLCFERHATSKIRESEELLSVRTLGFRGEALPSIASVAKVRLKTRAEADDLGTEVLIEGGILKKVAPIAWPGGTTIEVRSLFYNTPARRKFLRTQQTELRHISAMLTRLALAHPKVRFLGFHKGRSILDLVPYPEALERIANLYGPKLAKSLTALHRSEEDHHLHAYIGPLHDTKSGSDYQHTFVNGRAVQSPTLRAAIRDAFRLVLPKGRLPVIILYLELPHGEVDVNVHPTKAEVRFFSPYRVRRFLTDALGEYLAVQARGDLPRMSLGRDRNERLRLRLDSVYPEKLGAAGAASLEGRNPRVSPASSVGLPGDEDRVRWARAETSFSGARPGAAGERGRQSHLPLLPGLASQSPTPRLAHPYSAGSVVAAESGSDRGTEGDAAKVGESFVAPVQAGVGQGDLPRLGLSQLRYIGQLANTFLLLEDEEGLVIIDQHVAHERVRLEALIDGVRNAKRTLQPLLIPIVIEFPPEAVMALERGNEPLLQLGFEIDSLDGGSVAVRTAPANLPVGEIEPTVRLLVRRLLDDAEELPEAAQLVEDALVMAACKGAIKANDPLAPQEAKALIQKLDRARHPFSCPHGRPSYFRLPLRQIEREFGRMGFGS